MIYKEGGCIDAQHGTIWVCLEYFDRQQKTKVCIRDKRGGRRLLTAGLNGHEAKRVYDNLSIYFFGNV